MSNTSFDPARIARANVVQMKPYSSARDEFQGEADVYLDANESPYPTPYNRYPDPLQWELKKKIAELKGIPPEQIFVGNGSDEPIDLLIRAFCTPAQDAILITEPTYGMYSVCADVNDVAVQRVLLTTTFALDEAAVRAAVTDRTKIIFLCSPNNPSGNLLAEDAIRRIARDFSGLVVVDEAYIDFAGTRGFLPHLKDTPNLVVLQTFSKAWGLAALRCGMAFASPAIISLLNKIKYPYNVNILTQEKVIAALADAPGKDRRVREILDEREKLSAALESTPGIIQVFPSDANFILVQVSNAAHLYQYLLERKIIVRDRSRVQRCGNCIRITVGTPEENRRLIAAIRSFPEQNAVSKPS